MSHTKSLALIGLALAAPTATHAFVVNPQSSARPHTSLDAANDPSPANAIRNLAAASALTFGLLFPGANGNALAAQQTTLNNDHHVLQSSSVHLSVEIKTMDFSMPSSYDSIKSFDSDPDELKQTTIVNTAASTKKTAKSSSTSSPAKKKEKKESAPPGMSAKEASEAARAAKTAARKAKEAEQAEADAKAAVERDANIKAARLAKIAAREEARAEKEAADAAAAEEAKFKGAKFVDTSMPSY